MTPQTFTPAQARELTIPATDELLRGWVGPAVYAGRDVVVLGPGNPGYIAVAHFWISACESGLTGVRLADLLLPLSRREVRHRLIDVAADGAVCVPCVRCGNTSWLRKPADLSAFRDGPALTAPGWTSAELSALLLWISWRRMEAGAGPIVAVYRPWRSDQWHPPRWRRDALIGRTVELYRHFHDVPPHLRGQNDDRAIAKGVALLNDDGTLTAEVP